MKSVKFNGVIRRVFVVFVLLVSLPVLAQVTVDLDDDDQVIINNGNTVVIGKDLPKIAVQGEEINLDQVMKSLGSVVHDDIIQINLAGKVLFDYDSDRIGPVGKEKLHQIASVIRNKAKGGVKVIGHTDNKGSDQYNRQLSLLRAKAVIRWLHDEENLPLKIMQAEAAGSHYPVAPNQLPDGRDNPEGRAQNRRVEIQIATREGVRLGAGLIPAAGVNLQQPHIEDGPGSCSQLCELTGGRHNASTIACLEGVFEELGYDMDEGSCDKLEDAMFLGMGNEKGKMCTACVQESRVSDQQCRKVMATCFR